MTTKLINVTRTPPKRSDSAPPTGRASAERPEERVMQDHHVRELRLRQHGEAGGETDERSEVARYSKLSIHKCPRLSTGGC